MSGEQSDDGLSWAEKASQITAIRFNDEIEAILEDGRSPSRSQKEVVAASLGLPYAVIDAEIQPRHRGASKRLHTVNSSELWKMKHPPTKWAVDGILPDGATLFCGRQKVGKSWFALDVSIGVSEGGLALGSAKCAQGDILLPGAGGHPATLDKETSHPMPR